MKAAMEKGHSNRLFNCEVSIAAMYNRSRGRLDDRLPQDAAQGIKRGCTMMLFDVKPQPHKQMSRTPFGCANPLYEFWATPRHPACSSIS
jgi:hypothetical protein